jgi:hypothetical protein
MALKERKLLESREFEQPGRSASVDATWLR